MDKTSKSIIDYLKKQPNYSSLYQDVPFDELRITDDDFYTAIRYLEKKGLVEIITMGSQHVHVGARLSHEALHQREIKRDSFKQWFFSTYLGGVITGITTTLATEVLLYLGARILVQLLSQ